MTLLSKVQPINGIHVADTKVTPPEDGLSQPLKATQVMRGPEEELGVEKNFELSTTTTVGLPPVPMRTSAMTRTITHSKGQKLQAPPSRRAKKMRNDKSVTLTLSSLLIRFNV
jgi:hypothetical protein